MGKTTIEWCEYTFNPWIGCAKVSPGCAHCYAETVNKRFKGGAHWGPNADRWFMDDKYWKRLRSWSDRAGKAGQRARVFVASHADVFEEHSDVGILTKQDQARHRLWRNIEESPNLIFLLLTKRPENIARMAAPDWMRWGWPDNVMILTSVEDQQRAHDRIGELLKIPARWRGLSVEPLLGPLDLRKWLYPFHIVDGAMLENIDIETFALEWQQQGGVIKLQADQIPGVQPVQTIKGGIDWVIVGGESGQLARPMASEWPRKIGDQCRVAGVPFFFKQWGEYLPFSQEGRDGYVKYDNSRWFYNEKVGEAVIRMGKKAAGRILDGRTHDDHPFDLKI